MAKNIREKLLAKGFVRKDIFVPPQAIGYMKQIETLARQGIFLSIPTTEEIVKMTKTLDVVYSELVKHNENTGEFAFEKLTNEDGSLLSVKIDVLDAEELPMFLSVSGNEIVIMSTVFTSDALPKDKVAEVDHLLLSLNTSMALSNVGVIDGRYVVKGNLSARSDVAEVVEEIYALADNATSVAEAVLSVVDNEVVANAA